MTREVRRRLTQAIPIGTALGSDKLKLGHPILGVRIGDRI